MSLRLDETEIRVIKLKALIEAYTLLSIDSKAIHDLNPDDLKNWSDELEELTRDGNYLDVFPSEWDIKLATSSLTFQGEQEIDITTHPDYKDKTIIDWMLYFIERYGGYDGSHHKDWVLDQVARIANGTPVIVRHASWSGNDEISIRVTTGEPSQAYLDWVVEMKSGEDGADTYDYDEGIAP
jgi:hypothetical protein